MYDMNDEWDRYMLRYGGYSNATLAEFEERGIAVYNPDDDSYTITPDTTYSAGTGEVRPVGEPFVVRNEFACRKARRF